MFHSSFYNTLLRTLRYFCSTRVSSLPGRRIVDKTPPTRVVVNRSVLKPKRPSRQRTGPKTK